MLRTLPLLLIASFSIGCQCTTALDVLSDTSPSDSDLVDSEGPLEDTAPVRYHADDYFEPDVHGLEAKLATLVCVSCHGEDLMGMGRAASCDSCHPDGWRQDCVFCHGGIADQTGAPPLHISGAADGPDASFIPHQAHVVDTDTHVAFGCVQCHAVPLDVLSQGHLFLGDASPARAETDFSGGIDSTVGWDDSRTCVSSWCHGDGQGATGRVEHSDEVADCAACHESTDSGSGGWLRMTGEHDEHLDRGLSCSHCHGDVAGEGDAIIGLSLHVNGENDIAIGDTWVSWEGGSCDGLCHTDGFWYWHWSSGWE